MHVLLRPASTGHASRLRPGLSHPIHSVRTTRRIEKESAGPSRAPAKTGGGQGSTLRRGRKCSRRLEFLLPLGRPAGDLWLAVECEIAEPGRAALFVLRYRRRLSERSRSAICLSRAYSTSSTGGAAMNVFVADPD